ncbi:casein kinase 2 regulatory subunit [Thoreauomyces humboldtii]|nr:casein kinase 2 regulatory subunit [Thoreauomyces humboldtii]
MSGGPTPPHPRDVATNYPPEQLNNDTLSESEEDDDEEDDQSQHHQPQPRPNHHSQHQRDHHAAAATMEAELAHIPYLGEDRRSDDLSDSALDDPGPPPGQESTEDEDDSDLTGTDSESGSSVVTWISWYCSLPGHEFFLEVPDEFIVDDFNLTGLASQVVYFDEAIDLILDLETEDLSSGGVLGDIESSAEVLYGCIHARYIITKQGLLAMAKKFHDGIFGACPRVYCNGIGLLPMGVSDVPGVATVKMVCGRCCDIYHPKEPKYQSIDGAFFGTTFAHFLWLTYPELQPRVTTNLPRSRSRSRTSSSRRRPPRYHDDMGGEDQDSDLTDEAEEEENDAPNDHHGDDVDDDDDDEDGTEIYRIYEPRIFGFRVNEQSSVAPKMAWLRWKPSLDDDLDEEPAM